MDRTVQQRLSNVLGILGWHGMFLQLVIVAFKLFLSEQEDFLCPCTWFVAYGTIMLLFPSLTCYLIAFFTYFRQHNGSAPWKVLKTFYVFKLACRFYDGRTEWDFHVKRCIRCNLVERDWTLVKIAVSAVLSLLYPFVWLSLSFLQATYYACAQVGPTGETLQNYCNMESRKLGDHVMAYGLAVIRSKVIGSILFTITLFLLGMFVIIYGEIKSYVSKRNDWTPNGKRLPDLQVQVCILPSHSPGPLRAATSHGFRNTSVTRAEEITSTGGQFSFEPPAADGRQVININLNSTFKETLQRYVNGDTWQQIEVHCCQRDEVTNWRKSFAPSRASTQHERMARESGYQSFHQLLT